jgi:hypothetical protein
MLTNGVFKANRKGYMYKTVVLIGMVVGGSLYGQNKQDFIIQKPQKKVESKIDCGQFLTQGLKESTQQLKQIADLQERGFAMAELMLDDSFFPSLTKEQMQQESHAYKQFMDRQEHISNLIAQQQHFLADQGKKYGKKG